MRLFSPLLLFCIAPVLGGCGGDSVASSLGLTRTAPDEFVVVSRPPLSIPPEFALRPPRPGEPPLGTSANEKARALLTGKPQDAGVNSDPASLLAPTVETAVTPVTQSEALSGGASSLLKRAGGDVADESVRDKLREDASKPADTSNAKTLMDKLVGADKSEPLVDAPKEAERLRTNKDTGKPISEGDVPEAMPAKRSLIDRIF